MADRKRRIDRRRSLPRFYRAGFFLLLLFFRLGGGYFRRISSPFLWFPVRTNQHQSMPGRGWRIRFRGPIAPTRHQRNAALSSPLGQQNGPCPVPLTIRPTRKTRWPSRYQKLIPPATR